LKVPAIAISYGKSSSCVEGKGDSGGVFFAHGKKRNRKEKVYPDKKSKGLKKGEKVLDGKKGGGGVRHQKNYGRLGGKRETLRSSSGGKRGEKKYFYMGPAGPGEEKGRGGRLNH